nr:leucine-rich repeat protein [Prevotella sp.]
MKKLLFVLTLFCALTIDAQTFVTVDNVRYLIEDDHAVVARQDKELAGNIEIPASIEYNEVNYNVTRLISPSDSESGGGGAFQECEITGITLPEAITEIPDQAFMECKQLSSVTFEGVVTRIGRQAFMLCEALSTIDLPDDVTEIGDMAFYGAGLTEFRIPAGVTELKFMVLCDTKISYLEIPATVTLGNGCFATGNRYKTYGPEWPSRRTVKIYHRDCRGTSADINTFGDMTNIDLLVPAGSKAVYQEYLPWMRMNSITEFGEETGESIVPDQRHVTIDDICYMLKDGEAQLDIQPETLSGEVVIPEQVTYEGIDYPVTAVIDGECDVFSYEYFKPRTVLSQTQVTKITLPVSIKRIGWLSFQGSPCLEEVVLNEGLQEMDLRAFSECYELTTINIPSSLSALPNAVFWNCDKLTTISLHEGITSLDWEALWNTGLETLTIPSTCTNLSYRTLAIPNLKTLIMKVKEPTEIKSFNSAPMNCTVFGYEDQEGVREYLSNVDLVVPLGCAESYSALTPWFYCRSITEEGDEYYQPKTIGVNIDGINYVLHETVNEQDETVRTATIASQNPSLSGDIDIPEKVSYAKKVLQGDEWVTLEAQDYDVTEIIMPGFEIDEAPAIHRTVGGAFQECAVTSIRLPATITTIPPGTFNGCKQLKSVTLAEGITTIGAGAFANCTSLENIYLPETITDMSGWYIFGNCPSLKKVNIPKQVTTLGGGCFALSGIETFIIPKNVTNIGEWCFGWDKNDNLKSIKICHDTYSDGSISFPESMFSDVSGITLIVPEGTKETLYSQVYPWKKFDNIIEYKDQNDLHQYNAYRVAYTEEILKKEPAGARRRSPSAEENTTTLGYIPSGVLLPEGNVKEGYALIEWQKEGTPVGEDARMPAQDIVLKGIFALKGDVNGDGKVTPADAIMILYQYFNVEQKDFLEKAAD